MGVLPGYEGVVIRPAVASERDGLAFARLLDEAQEGWYRMALGSSASNLIAEAFVVENHELSFEFVTIVERDGEAMAMSCAYSGRAHRGFGTNPLDTAVRGRLRYRVMTTLSSRMLDFMGRIPDDDFYLRAIAVDPAQRGHGIGSALLGVVTERALSSGCRRLALDVAASNTGGQRLYERYGMTIDSESPRFLGLPRTNVYRMVKDL